MQCFYFQTSIVKQDLDYDLKKKKQKRQGNKCP
jgi:hypothetical protein